MPLALTQSVSHQMLQRQHQRMTYKLWMGLNFLRMPIRDLAGEIKKQIDTNPALADIKFELPPGWRPTTAASLAGDNSFIFENQVATESLYEHLIKELEMSGIEAEDLKQAAAEIIGDLDANGRYVGDATDELHEKARHLVMTLDPLGCGARDLTECYIAQIENVPKADREAARAIILKLGAVLKGEARLERKDQVLAARLLACLDAKPGSHYSTVSAADYIIPDIILSKSGDVSIEHGTIPELRVSPRYANLANDREQPDEVRAYAQEMVRHVKELQEAVAKRFETLDRIALSVCHRQWDFLSGKGPLQPMTMRDVAGEAKCSVSTVSRTAERKYIRAPRGLVRLRDLFSARDVGPMNALRRLLADPDASKLSDQKLSRLLELNGVSLARRTVNKYRRIIENETK